jgi:hypothetical protein
MKREEIVFGLSELFVSAKRIQALASAESVKSGIGSFLRFCEGMADIEGQSAEHPAKLTPEARSVYEARKAEMIISNLAEDLKLFRPFFETVSERDDDLDFQIDAKLEA